MRVSVNDVGVLLQVANSENTLEADLCRFTRLLPELALGSVLHELLMAMDRRYGDRLGVPAGRVGQEHLVFVEAARFQSHATR